MQDLRDKGGVDEADRAVAVRQCSAYGMDGIQGQTCCLKGEAVHCFGADATSSSCTLGHNIHCLSIMHTSCNKQGKAHTPQGRTKRRFLRRAACPQRLTLSWVTDMSDPPSQHQGHCVPVRAASALSCLKGSRSTSTAPTSLLRSRV